MQCVTRYSTATHKTTYAGKNLLDNLVKWKKNGQLNSILTNARCYVGQTNRKELHAHEPWTRKCVWCKIQNVVVLKSHQKPTTVSCFYRETYTDAPTILIWTYALRKYIILNKTLKFYLRDSIIKKIIFETRLLKDSLIFVYSKFF